jgi:hypothetical protein
MPKLKREPVEPRLPGFVRDRGRKVANRIKLRICQR